MKNPALSWAAARHDPQDAGFVLLTWIGEDSRSTEKRFFQPVSFGREAGNDIELDDARVSRFHAVLWAEDGNWHIRDLDSANGTFIENSRVSGSAALPANCELRFHPNGPTVYVTVTKSPETMIG
jgi:pSer/pThr/pTyr-binding forkhead associated (FHA) protein